MAKRGGNVSTGTGRGGGESFRLDINVDGLDKASAEFKQIRRTINARLRDAMVEAGEHSVLPVIKEGLPDKWSAGLYVRRDRSGVVISSRLRGPLNRALGWFDFGGRRPRDTKRREGPHVIVNRLQGERPAIDKAIREALEHAFAAFGARF